MEYEQDPLDQGLSHAYYSDSIKRAGKGRLLRWLGEIKEARTYRLARLGEGENAPRNEDGTRDLKKVETDPLLRVVLHMGVQHLAAKQKEIEEEIMSRPGGIEMFM